MGSFGSGSSTFRVVSRQDSLRLDFPRAGTRLNGTREASRPASTWPVSKPAERRRRPRSFSATDAGRHSAPEARAKLPKGRRAATLAYLSVQPLSDQDFAQTRLDSFPPVAEDQREEHPTKIRLRSSCALPRH